MVFEFKKQIKSLALALFLSLLPFFLGVLIHLAENVMQCDILEPCANLALRSLLLLLYGSLFFMPVAATIVIVLTIKLIFFSKNFKN